MWVTLDLRKKELKQEHANYQLADLQISRQKRQLDRRKRYEQALIQKNQKTALNPIKLSYQEKIAELNKNKAALQQYMLAVKSLKNNSLNNYVLAGENNDVVFCKNSGGHYVLYNEEDKDPQFFDINGSDVRSAGVGKYERYSGDNPNDDDDDNWHTMSLEQTTDGAIQYYQKAYDLSQYAEILATYSDITTDLSSITEDTDLTTIESTVNNYLSQIQLDQQEAQTSRMDEENNAKLIWENELEMLEEEVGDEETQLELEQTDIETQMEYISTELESINQAASNEIKSTAIKLA